MIIFYYVIKFSIFIKITIILNLAFLFKNLVFSFRLYKTDYKNLNISNIFFSLLLFFYNIIKESTLE